MKKICFFILVLNILPSSGISQNICINSVTNIRQPAGDVGYTLDGIRMTGARAKLLSPDNFGTAGIYQKSISIQDGFGTSGSLVLDTVPMNSIFFFGAFNRHADFFQQFTSAEIDSLYNWSKNGGKLIIAAEPSLLPDYEMDILDQRWGFHLNNEQPNGIIPTSTGMSTEIFNGPFGAVYAAYQGGSLQGYFDAMPDNSVVYATNSNSEPTLILDCNTLDLIIADVDGFTDLGGITAWGGIVSSNDRFWVNAIVFMDNLQAPPVITNYGSIVTCTENYSYYQWYLDGIPITGANAQSYNATHNGSYSVEVTLNCGCKIMSNIIIIDDIPGANLLIIPNVFTPNGDGCNDYFVVMGDNMRSICGRVYNRWGHELFNWYDISEHWDGRCNGKNVADGVYFYVISVIFDNGETLEKHGTVEVLR
jgi:gliding motility-associated-like protein